MLRKSLYPHFEPLINQLVGFLSKKGVTPNQLTLAGAAFSLLAGISFAGGQFFLGGLLLLVSGLGDLLDGPLARLTGKTSSFGAFLDSTMDRYADFFIFGGIAIHFTYRGEIFWFVVTLGIILGAFVVSYAKARAENFIPNCGVGVFGRAERLLLLILGIFVPPLFKWVLLLLLCGTHGTAVYRILHTQKILDKTPGS